MESRQATRIAEVYTTRLLAPVRQECDSTAVCAEVADVVQITKVRVLKALERRSVVRVSPESLEVDDVLSARDPALAQLAAAAVATLPSPSRPPNTCAILPMPPCMAVQIDYGRENVR
jgi:hypothetical protein